MIPLPLSEVVEVTSGRLSAVHEGPPPWSADTRDVVVDGPVVTDSRACAPGSLYVARVGEHADGHDFVAAAEAAGAVAALVEREVDVALPQVVVPDAQAAFGRLARRVVDRGREGGLVVVAVTGSSGKTSTKDLLAQVLAPRGPLVAPPGNWNNEIGVPLTVLSADEGTLNLVAEMGARGPGHLTYLSAVAPPDVAVVLNVGLAHAGEFGGLDGVERAKGELVEALRPGGVAVLNLDDDRVARMASRAPDGVSVVTTSTDETSAADVRAGDVRLDDRGRASFALHAGGGSTSAQAHVSLRLHGEHHVANALAVAAVALHLGADVGVVAEALSQAAPASRWRMEVGERADGVVVVNDAYNANPDSVRAALKALAAMRLSPDGTRRRTWAVLGEMLELGDESVRLHDEIGRLAVRLDVSHVVAVGAGARSVHTGAVMEGSWGAESVWVPDVDAAFDLLHRELRGGDVVLFKSSRDSGLRWLGERVAADGAADRADDAADAVHAADGGDPR